MSNACLESWFSLFRRGIKGLNVIVGTNKQVGSGMGRTNKHRGKLPTSSPSHLFVIKWRWKSFSKLFGGQDWGLSRIVQIWAKGYLLPLTRSFLFKRKQVCKSLGETSIPVNVRALQKLSSKTLLVYQMELGWSRKFVFYVIAI